MSQESWQIPEVEADSNFVDGVASRDVKIFSTSSSRNSSSSSKNKDEQDEQEQEQGEDEEIDSQVWVRLYLPDSALNSKSKLPILVHVHGGGFVRFSAATASYHAFCNKVAADATALVLSLNHRLAPAARLPAAYHDLVAALRWLREQAVLSAASGQGQGGGGGGLLLDPWLAAYADFSKCVFMGGSSGGNIVHNALLMLLQSGGAAPLPPLNFVAQILLQPFFGGAARSQSELRLCQGPILTLSMSDQLWNLALPEGATREHPFCDPLAAPLSGKLLPRALVLVGGRDLLHDRQVEFAAMLETSGVEVKLVEYPEATHGFVTSDGTVSYIFMPDVLHFIRSSVDSSQHSSSPASSVPEL